MACPGCEIVPKLRTDASRLYMAPKLSHTASVTMRQLGDKGWHVEPLEDTAFYVSLEQGHAEGLLDDLSAIMSRPEQSNCPAALLPDDQEFGVRHLGAMEPLGVLIARQEHKWLSQLLDDERIEMHFQPIIHTSSGKDIFAYECLARGIGQNGELIRPDQLFSAARAADLMFHMDRAARIAAIRDAHAQGITENVFINFNPTSVYDPVFCLQTTFNEVRRLQTSPERYVFEVVETDLVEDSGHLEDILREYRRHGFRVALDDLGAGYGSLNMLQSIRPDFVKLDRGMIDGVSQDSYRASITGRLIDMSKDLGVSVIAEGIEREEDWHWLRDREVDFVQGFYFARPARVPPRP